MKNKAASGLEIPATLEPARINLKEFWSK